MCTGAEVRASSSWSDVLVLKQNRWNLPSRSVPEAEGFRYLGVLFLGKTRVLAAVMRVMLPW